MEAHGNEYVAQLLDRAATLITAAIDDRDTEASEWLQEYHAEKARFGQPLGSPAYVDAVQAARGEDVPRQQRQARADAGVATVADQGGGSVAYEDMTLAELQEAARTRGLHVTGNKTDLRERLEDDDRDANS